MRKRNEEDKEMEGHGKFETMMIPKATGWQEYGQASFKKKIYFFNE